MRRSRAMTTSAGEQQANVGPEPKRFWGRRRRWSDVTLFVAALWCIGLVVAAATVPTYTSTTTTAGGPGAADVSTTGTETLLAVNGAGVLVVVGLPLVAVASVAAALTRRRR